MTYCTNKNGRRHFLRQLAAGIACGGMANMRLPLSLMGTALTASKSMAASNYRALVCVYLFGGNDSWNLLVPHDTTQYNQYAAARGNLAIARNTLLPITPLNGGDYGIHSSCPELCDLFNQHKLAFITNIGTLVEPITKIQYQNNTKRKPPQLFSHIDQTRFWHTGSTDLNAPYGRGGRFADKLQALNPQAQMPLAVSSGGHNTQFVAGASTFPYPTEGRAARLFGYAPDTDYYNFGGTRRQALMDMLALNYDNQLLEKEYSKILKRSVDLEAVLNPALDAAPPLSTVFPDSGLGRQLKMVAQLIQLRNTLALNHQIFFVEMPEFDLHSGMLQKQPGQFRAISQAVSAFYNALAEPAINAQNDVTLFTMSEFGRILSSNGDGSDHAWGGNQFVVGGAVNGGALYGGAFPELTLDGPETFERGQVIPSTSVDQMAATLGTWMGMTPGDLQTIFPNLNNFASSNLGFMAI